MKTTSFLAAVLVIFLLGCRKENFITSGDARLSTSVDSLKFDTVFTTVGSITKSFKIFNDNNQKLRLESVKLMGGSASAFKMNVDGTAATEVNNIEVEANDSVYVFVQVNVNPSASNLPFIISDSIEIRFNGNTRKVQLEAWGQQAHFLRGHEVNGTETWNNDRPYVILDYLYVAENAQLNIEKGCRVYVHSNAPLVIDGSLHINGLKDTVDRVYFAGDRLDDPYRNYPASWPGIYFRPTSHDNTLRYAVLKNAYQAIAIEDPSPNANPKLIMNETIIDNAYDAGIIAVNSSIRANNTLVTNCGRNVLLGKGGSYQFTHCTIATVSNNFILHKDPVLQLTDTDGSTTAAMNASFINCIFWGQGGLVENEVAVAKTGNLAFTVNFNRGIWKVNSSIPNTTSTGMINADPVFDSIDANHSYFSFRLKEGSPAINAGIATALTTDLDGKPRPVGLPDLGCFEKQ